MVMRVKQPWEYASAAEEIEALRAEVERLREENKQLRDELIRLKMEQEWER